jgi:hypothetical protein
MSGIEREWRLTCGHMVPMLKHHRPDELPRRPRMRSTCGRPRVIESPASGHEPALRNTATRV